MQEESDKAQCDELRPKCGRCQRTGIDCSLTDPTSGLILIPAKGQTHQKRQASTGSPDSNITLVAPYSNYSFDARESLESPTSQFPGSTKQTIVEINFTDLERERLQLMSHYTLHTAGSITQVTVPRDGDLSIWSQWVTGLAFENDFLLHGLLSLSALHLELCGVSTQKNTVAAIRHHRLGVTLFLPYIDKTPMGNFDAVFAFSWLVSLYSFGIQRSSKPGNNTIANIHQVLTLIRGTSHLIKTNLEAARRSRWSMLLLPAGCPSSDVLPQDMEDMLSKLLQRASTTFCSTSQLPVYTSAIEALRFILAIWITCPRVQLTVTLFPILTAAEYLAMVAAGEPLALAILANYAVVLFWLRHNVWMKGWGKETVDAVCQALPPEWQDCIAWAKQETQCS
ncbi:hypothetical protein A1O1_00775 [Capronia coronata CBS 617.96]|uniref:Zn(2)-C6 fungal-type domain-containing protein n=1 Tax=Capronia coronata CBS 617.96 TaxID=1182541 RepID=W9YSX6_9EURO|nr:uncharacterized protein A1O1_00775 [Capronia coronata CBS 617.96]EXJ95653.1 hypothetical protein A1O1_00775 [Capronia coronata CBS 617.96]